jgi:hypothetical protein
MPDRRTAPGLSRSPDAAGLVGGVAASNIRAQLVLPLRCSSHILARSRKAEKGLEGLAGSFTGV